MVPVIDRVFPLSEAAEAHRYLDSQQRVGKVLPHSLIAPRICVSFLAPAGSDALRREPSKGSSPTPAAVGLLQTSRLLQTSKGPQPSRNPDPA
ncbi:zinc-binding dehydrogenase [Devosia beringensis]|uniref:zinc-binding dehydrogenase n=1 Tax=Devosia beringensis TaxID=2657486 RepID=UPI00186B7BDB